MISTLCLILSAQATWSGEPIIGEARLTFALCSSNNLTKNGSPRKIAKSSGDAPLIYLLSDILFNFLRENIYDLVLEGEERYQYLHLV